MKLSQRFTALSLALTMGAGTIVFPAAAQASEEGKRNTAIGLGAAAAGLLLTQHNKIPGVVAAAGAAYAYKRYDDDVRSRHRREGDYGYDYNRNDRYNRDNNNSRDRYNSDRNNRDNGYNSSRYNRNNRYNQDDTYTSSRYNRNDRYSSDYGYSRDSGDGADCRDSSGRYSSRRR